MDTVRWERVEAIFLAALDHPPEAWDAFVAQGAGGDRTLEANVHTLLQAHASDPDFLEEPLARVDTLMPEGMAPAGPRFAGPYRLVRRLGRGGMGEVHLAIQEGSGFTRSVAVKLIRPGMDSEEVLRRFALERRVLAGLKHPNIVPLLDAGITEDGRPYVVMEFVEGEPIDSYCDRRRAGVVERIHLFRTVCDAVQHAHQRLTLHRDLKPANILVGEDGVPRLLDFGIAKITAPGDGGGTDPGALGGADPGADDGARPGPGGGTVLGSAPGTRFETRTRARMLTPEYAAPEQIRGDVVSAATDVYGLGGLLYELLTGSRPLTGPAAPGAPPVSAADRERAVLEREPTRPSAAVAAGGAGSPRHLRGDLDTIVLKALRKEPERRYPSAAALSEDLARYLDGRPILSRPDTLAYRTGKFLRRNRVAVGAAAIVVVALLSAATVTFAQSRRVAAERDKALEVQGFLLEMFGATGPDQAAGDSVTARQLLDRQAAALETTYGERPAARADMMTVLAEGYDRLGLPAEAEALAERALEVRTGALSADHPDIAASMALLGWIRHQAGRSDEGEAMLRDAVARWRAAGAHPRELSRALNDLGVIRDAAGDYDEAETLYAEALDLRRDVYGTDHRAFAVTASNLSVIRYRRGDYQGAVAAALLARDAMRASLGPDHQRSTIIQSNLAAMRAALGDDEGAEAEYRDLLDRQERLQGPSHPTTIGVLRSLGGVLSNQGRWAEAEIPLRRALEAQEATLGSGHPEVAFLKTRLAQALNGQERHAEARVLLEQAVEVYDATLGHDHARVAEALESMADALEPEDPERATAVHREAIAISERTRGAAHPETGVARMRLADRFRERGSWADAAALYDSAAIVLVDALPAAHPHVHRVRTRRAEMNWALGRTGVTDSLLREAESGLAAGGADSSTVALQRRLRAALGGGGA